MPLRALLLIAIAAATTGCGGDADAPSAEQNRALDSADRMLDDAPNSLDQVENTAPATNAAESPDEER